MKHFFLFIFLIVNFMKSDSILYISSITLFIFTSVLNYSNNILIFMNNKICYLTYQSFPSETANSLQTISNINYLIKNNIDVDLIFPLREELVLMNGNI